MVRFIQRTFRRAFSRCLVWPFAQGCFTLLLAAGVAVPTSGAIAQVVAAPASRPASAPKIATASPKPAAPSPVNKSGWTELTRAQQASLLPLASTWSSISAGQKRKWIALSQNFQNLSPAERDTLHGRMTEWANLSPVQRSQARLNFAETKRLSAEEKKAKWLAYQALSPEQKQQLASDGPPQPGGAAPAVTPVGPNKLAVVPVTRSDPAGAASAPSKPRTAPIAARVSNPASAPETRP